MLKSPTGIGVGYIMKYDGLTPKAGFKIRVHWHQVYTHYSEHHRAQASGGNWFFSAGASFEKQSAFNELVNKKAIELEAIEGPGFRLPDMKPYIDPIMTRLNSEMLDELKAPPVVNPIQAGAPDTGNGFFVRAGYSVAIKDVRQTKESVEEISFGVRSTAECTAVAEGFVGLSEYPEEVARKSILIVPPGPWRSTYYLLPVLGNDPAIGIEGATMSITLMDEDHAVSTQTARWTLKDGWIDANQRPTLVMAFPVLGLVGDRKLDGLKYRTRLSIQTRQDDATYEQTQPVADGEFPLQGRRQVLFDTVVVDAGHLTFQDLDRPDPTGKLKTSNLEAVHVVLESGDRSLRQAITPWVSEDGTKVHTPPYRLAGAQGRQGWEASSDQCRHQVPARRGDASVSP